MSGGGAGGTGNWGAPSSSRQNSDSPAVHIGSPVPMELSGSASTTTNEILSGGGIPLQFDEGVLRQLCDLDVSRAETHIPAFSSRVR